MILPVIAFLLPFAGGILLETSAVSQKTKACNLGAIHFQMDERLQEDEPGVYVDPDSETLYFVDSSLYAAAPEDVRAFLESDLKELEELSIKRSCQFAASDGELLQIEGPDGQVYQYDEYVFTAMDNTVLLGYAIYLPQNQCIVRISAIADQEPAEHVETRILAMLNTLKVDTDGELTDMSQFELTEENYQSFFAPAAALGYEHVGRGFIKAPEGMFDEGSFADAYLPYSSDASYSEDGTTMHSRAHGVQLDVALVHHTGMAADVVKEMAQQTFAAKNKELNGELISDEELNLAVWVSFHDENGVSAPLLCYADIKVPEYYLTAVITYYPAEQDEFSDALLEELSDVGEDRYENQAIIYAM